MKNPQRSLWTMIQSYDEFYVIRKHYDIKHNKTNPDHPQMNRKIECLNYELLQRLQWISAEEEKMS